ncbi:MAG: mechanosensitive ion channel [Muribaculaceae bacterium]|nr:mechanosensitive ion channel [Muribaculaceae bacterium]
MKLLTILLQDILPEVADSVASGSDTSSALKSLTLEELMARLISGVTKLAINIAIALLVFYVGKYIIRKLYTLVSRILLRRNIDSSLTSFVLSFVRIVLYFILIVTVIGILGIETSSFLALFASAGVAIGMALSGTLQNFAGGVLILLLKPYRVGDYIDAQGYAGTVKEIQIFHTLIVTPDNKAIIIPNGQLSTGSVNNWSKESLRRVDWSIGISYGDDVDYARAAILDIINANPGVMSAAEKDAYDKANPQAAPEVHEPTPEEDQEDSRRRSIADFFRSRRSRIIRHQAARQKELPALTPSPYAAPSVVVTELADSAVILKARAWVNTSDYWTVYYSVLETIYTQFKNSDHIHFPFPQMDVHLTK